MVRNRQSLRQAQYLSGLLPETKGSFRIVGVTSPIVIKNCAMTEWALTQPNVPSLGDKAEASKPRYIEQWPQISELGFLGQTKNRSLVGFQIPTPNLRGTAPPDISIYGSTGELLCKTLSQVAELDPRFMIKTLTSQ